MTTRTKTARAPRHGECRYCGCTQFNACIVSVRALGRLIHTGCAWADKAQTVCSSPDCLTQANKDGIKLLEECRRTA